MAYTKKQIDEERELLLKSVEKYKEQLSSDLLNNSGADLKAEIIEVKNAAERETKWYHKLLKVLGL